MEKASVESKPWYIINRQMIPSKIAYFFEYCKEGSYWPYLVLFYVSIGLDPAQAGLIAGVRFIGGIFGGPVCGWIADKTGHHRSMAITVCFLASLMNILQPVISMLFMNPTENGNPANVLNKSSAAMVSDGTSSYATMEYGKVFFTLLAVSTAASFFDGSTMGFVDAGVLRNIMNSGTTVNYGEQRYLGPPGVGVAAFVSGMMIEYFPHTSLSPYTGAFVNYVFACVGMAITFYFLLPKKLQTYEVSPNFHIYLRMNLRKAKTWLFFIIVFFNGIMLAVAFSFSFLFLEELNTTSLVRGLSMCINGFTGALFFMISDRILVIIGGSINGMAVSCFFWSLRYLFLYLMSDPYQFLLICLLNGVTCALFVSSYVKFIKDNFPDDIYTVICGIAAALYNSGGYLVANVVGGIAYKLLGAHKLFLVCSFVSLSGAILTAFYGFLTTRKLPQSDNGETKTLYGNPEE